MRASLPKAARRAATLQVRRGRPADREAILALENALFTTDRLSPRSLRHFLVTPKAVLIVVARQGVLAGYALVVFRRGHKAARLYSIGVSPQRAGQGIGTALLNAAEAAARKRGCAAMRLEVQVANKRAVAWYRKSGYGLIGRQARYYEDGSDALRFEKPLRGWAADWTAP